MWDGSPPYSRVVTNFLYSVEREYAVPVDAMWAAWTDAEALERWYHPTDLANLPGATVSEPVVGGWWTVAVNVPEFNVVAYFYGRYREVAPMTRLVHDLAYTTVADEFAARDESVPMHRIEIDMEDRGDRTWVRFTQFGVLPEGEAARAQAGMESYFDSLGTYLQPDQYRPMDQA